MKSETLMTMMMMPDVANDDDDDDAGVGGVEPPIPRGGGAGGGVNNSVAPLASSSSSSTTTFTDELPYSQNPISPVPRCCNSCVLSESAGMFHVRIVATAKRSYPRSDCNLYTQKNNTVVLKVCTFYKF